MPELPEVETVVRTLELQMQHPTITDVHVRWDNIIADPEVSAFCEQIIGQQFLFYDRIGKYLLFTLSDATLIVHLRMEGKFYYEDASFHQDNKHIHVVFDLDNGKQLRYHDVRKFGKMYLYPKGTNLRTTKALRNVGIDAMDPSLSARDLQRVYEKKHGCIKQLLLDQSLIAGIGNIYVDEICFRLRVHPNTHVVFTQAFCEDLLVAMRAVLTKAIAEGGTTIRSYTSSLGVSGRFQLFLDVHMQEGKACPLCQTTIIKTKVKGRGTYVCPHCQKDD
ncbi:MAG: DNA-formamidopyrimidine glycosylase [Erysipelotrichaceae bacterium]